MNALARKNMLAKNLKALQTEFPNEFNFFPKTWILPADLKDFKAQFNAKKAKTFIIKPEASCQGKGIFLTRNHDWLEPGDHYVAQRYLHKPYLIDGLKFDLRVYALITGVNPLRAYVFKEGLARFATQKYIPPVGSNLGNLQMHLTNYAINKDSDQFVYNEDENEDNIGHKRSMQAVLRQIEEEGKKSAVNCWKDIKDVITKTIISGQPQLCHSFRTAKPDDIENSLCFQVLGFDIMLDSKAKPWLIEVNQSPSFSTDTPLDYQIKKAVILQSILLLNLSAKRKGKYIAQSRAKQQRRVYTGKTKIANEEKKA